MINEIKKIKMKGFTLVELLAVIVILAIILVIAVPKVMDIINDAKKGTLESSAKMIANQAEKQKIQNAVLGKNDEITCDSIAKLNKGDYSSCSIKFENNIAKVTIEGNGKFEGLKVCDGTKTDATAVEGDCNGSGSSSSGMCLVDTEEKIYHINVDNCVTHLKSTFEEFYEEEYTDEDMREHCEREEDDEDTGYSSIYSYIGSLIEEELITKEELIEKGIYDIETKDICITEETPASCFEYEIIKNYRIKNVDSCVSYLKDMLLYAPPDDILTEEQVRELCQEKYVYSEDDAGYLYKINGPYDDSIYGYIHWLIETEKVTRQELIENDVINDGTLREIKITSYDSDRCGLESLIIPSTINGLEVTQIADYALSGRYKMEDCTGSCLYSLSPKIIKLPSTVYKIGEIAFYPANYYDEYDEEYYELENEYKNKIYIELGNPNALIDSCAFGVNRYIQNHNLPDTYMCDGWE